MVSADRFEDFRRPGMISRPETLDHQGLLVLGTQTLERAVADENGSRVMKRPDMLKLAYPVSVFRPWQVIRDDAWMEHPNATMYRRTADAFRAGDRAALAAPIDGDVIWHIPGSGPMAGDIRGLEAVFRFLGRLRDVTEGSFTLKEHDVLGTDDHVVALSHMSAVREGIPVSVNVVSVFHFRDGRQQERWFHPSDIVAWDHRLLGGPN